MVKGHIKSYTKFGPIGSAVLTFIGYKQTNKQTDRQFKFKYRWFLDKYLLSQKKAMGYFRLFT